jgi:putative ABC transport system permease protein
MNAPNIPLLNVATLNNWLEQIPISTTIAVMLCYGLLAIAFKLLADWFLRTEIGILIRATGDNEQVVKCIAKNPEWFRLIGMGTANMLVALAGSLLAQNFGFADIGLGSGVIIVGFGSLLVGEAIIRPTRVVSYTLAALVGSVIYQFILAFGLRLGLAPTDLKLATGVMVIGLLAIKRRA